MALLLALVQNAALLLALAAVYDLSTSRHPLGGRPLRQVVVGLITGGVGIAIMLAPVRLEPGIVFDTRSVLLAISGLFLGPLPTAIAAVVTIAFRVAAGGLATGVGVGVILTSSLLGACWRRWRQGELDRVSARELYALGLVVHVVMLAWMLLLPGPSAVRVLRSITLPVLVLYPAATAALGLLLARRLHRERDADRLAASETRLREALGQFERAQAVAHLGSWVWHLRTNRLEWSSQMFEIFGIDQATFDGDLAGVVARAIHPDDRAAVAERANKAVVEAGRPVPIEYRVVRPDGSVRLVRGEGGELVLGTDGQPDRLSGVALDITELKANEEALRRSLDEVERAGAALLSVVEDHQRTEAALRQSEHDYRLLFQANPHAMWIYDRDDLRFLEVNDQAVARYGYSRDEFLAMTILDIRTNEEQARLHDHLERMQGDVANSGVWTHRRRNGTNVLVEVSSHGLTWKGRRARLVLSHDVTERERAKRELEASEESLRRAVTRVQQMNEELEDRVRQRTAELEAANAELEAFSSSVSHDLRAPLRGVNGFARLLEEEHAAQLDAEGRRLLAVVRSEASRMGRLIDDLLRLSRLGRQPLHDVAVDVATLVAGAVAEVRSHYPGRAIEVELGPLPATTADPSLLRQVWLNLIDNAFKYTAPRAAASIRIAGRTNAAENQYDIADNGVGFDLAHAGGLFAVFQRLHSAEEFEGTGVGLALAQRIVHRHGGRIWAEAEPERGATFHFTLPKSPGPQPRETSER